MKRIYYILSILSILIFTSCEDHKDCNSPVETSLGIAFYYIENGNPTSYTMPSPRILVVTKPDTIYLDYVKGISLPLNPHATLTQFYIQPDSTLTSGDTVSIKYTPDLQFISSGCGFINYYNLDTVTATSHYMDSIVISKREINTTNATNIKLYY